MKSTNRLLLLILFVLSFGCNSSILDDPATTIRYQVPEDSYVKLVVENSYKTLILTLVDEEQVAGAHEVSFSINDLAEGIYFYTLELKGIESNFYSKVTKNIMLLK